MRKIISAFLALMMLSGMFVFPTFASDALEITSGNLSDGDTNVGICPVVVYTFSQAIDEASLETVKLSGEDEIAIRQKALTEDGTTLTMRLGEELLYDTDYTLDISKVAAAADTSVTYGKTVSFTTKYGDNSTDDKYVWIKEDNFETGVYSTAKWRASDAAKATLAIKAKDGDESNTAFEFNSIQARLQNYQDTGTNKNTEIFEFADKAVFEFDLCVDQLTSSGSASFCTIADNYNTSTSLVTVKGGTTGGAVTIPNFTNGRSKAETITVCTWEPNVWMHFEFVVDIVNEVYSAKITKNSETSTYYCALAENTFMGNRIKGFYNQVYVGYNPLIYMDDISIRPYTSMDSNANELTLVSASVQNNEQNVAVAPVMNFTFDRAIDAQAYTPALYGESAIGADATVSGENNNVLTVTFDKDLEFNKDYVLNLSAVKAADGTVQGEDIAFKTVFGYNKVEESFNGEVDHSSTSGTATTKWRITDTNGIIHENDALHFVTYTDEGGTKRGANLENQNRAKGGAMMASNQVLQFDFKFDKTNTDTHPNINFALFFENTAEIGGIIGVKKNSDGETYKLTAIQQVANNYVEVGEKTIGEWTQVALILNPAKSSFRVALDGVLCDETFELPTAVAGDTLKFFRIGSSPWAFSDFWIDNLKIAQHLALLPNEAGEYETYFNGNGEAITTLDPEKTVYKAKIVNNAPVDEVMNLYLALYEEDSNEMTDIKAVEFTVGANSVYEIEEAFENLGDKAYTHKMKAIYTGSDGIKPYTTKMIPSAQSLESIDLVPEVKQISASDIYAAYPGGHYKSVTMRIDDNNANCNDAIVNAINAAGIKATFYLPGSGFTDASLYAGHEIGNHSYSHPATDIIHRHGITRADIEKGKTHNESISGQTVIGYGYPGSTYGLTGEEQYKQWIIETGHQYALGSTSYGTESTVPDLEDIYWIRESYRLTNNNVVAAAEEYAENTDKELSWFFASTHASDVYNTNDTVKNTNITSFLTSLGNRDDIWYAGNGELILYLLASRKVEIPEIVPGAKIVNTTKTTLYYNAYDAEGNLIETVSLNPGDTLEIVK